MPYIPVCSYCDKDERLDFGRSKFIGTHLYIWVKRGTMRVKCLAQEHNAVPWLGLEVDLSIQSSALTIRPLHLPMITFHNLPLLP